MVAPDRFADDRGGPELSADGKPIMVSSVMASIWFARAYGKRVLPATICQWACRKKITTQGAGRNRYNLREIDTFARKSGALDRSQDVMSS